jgi:hypothetical protein
VILRHLQPQGRLCVIELSPNLVPAVVHSGDSFASMIPSCEPLHTCVPRRGGRSPAGHFERILSRSGRALDGVRDHVSSSPHPPVKSTVPVRIVRSAGSIAIEEGLRSHYADETPPRLSHFTPRPVSHRRIQRATRLKVWGPFCLGCGATKSI